ncbi:T9SS type A sorting domain-containing protein [Mariniphaga sp.]|uniref:T9SS type A sorting domain-containing protein n=1 Tax=Mariniphaga sp. TaxID=1954475 RepID=UPI0035645EE3
MRKSFTWFLSLMVLLTAFATHGYAQEEQETVELYAEDASYCYNEADDYTVTISVRDFIKLNRFELALEFNDEIFDFVGVSNVHASLSALTTSEAGGIISVDWADDAATIGDNERTDILVLHFSVLGYPGNMAPSFTSSMVWGTTNFWYEIPDGDDLVNTDVYYDGSLTVDVEMTDIETTVTTETCAGGDVTLTVTEPDAEFYLFNEDPDPANWTDAWSTSPDYDVVAGETVTVRIKDANGCISLKQTVTVPETIEPVEFTVETQNPACYGGRGSVVFDANGGVAPYTYYISENSDGSDAVTRTNFQFSYDPGTYYVAVQDANGCANLADLTYWEEITITDTNLPVTGNLTITNVSCNGGMDGEISIEILEDGGAAVDVYEVSVDGGTTWGDAGEYTVEDLMAGDYSVKVRNTNGCVIDIDTDVEITEPDAITFDMDITDTSCGGDNDGEIIVTNIVGGTATYTLEIQEGENITTQSGVDAAGFTFTGLKPTYYSLTITDANGCVVEYINPNNTQNVISVQSPDDIQFDVEITDPACNDGDASIAIVNVTGGTGDYVYSFDGGTSWVDTTSIDVWPAPYAVPAIVVANAPVGEGDPTCEVTYSGDLTVDNPAELLASVEDWFAPTCIDGNDGSIRLRIEGGTKPYYYSINGSSARETSATLTNIRVGVGEHTILVWDDNGCEYEFDIVQDVDMEENVIEAVSDLHINCFGDKTGTISVNFTSWADGLTGEGGEPNRGVQFYVENEAGVVSSFGPSNIAATPTTFNAGTYIVWVVDQYTCESNPDTIEITQNPELLIDVVYTTSASCFNTFEGVITVHATGGYVPVDGRLEYAVVNNEAALGNIDEGLWLPFDTYNDEDYDPALSTVSFQVDGGTYWIAVRDDGCDEKWYGPIEVEGYEELLVDEDDIVAVDPLCFEGTDGSINVPMSAVSGGAGSYLFTLLEWVEGEWVELEDYTDQATGDFTGLPAGVYAVMVEDSEDCPSYTTEEIVLDDPDELTFTATYQHMSCEDSNDGLITVDITGGTPDYWYAINNTNSWIPIDAGETVKTHIATETGMFRIWIKDANECVTGPDTITILEPEALSADIDITDATCYGIADGEIEVEGIGGWDGYTLYEFKINDGTWSSDLTYDNLPAGDHVLYIRDAYNYDAVDTLQNLDCEYSVPFTIDSPEPITYTVVIEDVSCKDGSDGTLTVEIISGGIPYDLEGTANDGFDIQITGSDYDSGWIRSGDDNAYTFTDLAHSHYTVRIMDANGCTLAPTTGQFDGPSTTVESWEVNEPATYLTLDPEWVNDVTCYGGEDGQFVLNADGGTAPYKYWAGLSIEPDGHILVPNHPDEDSDEWQESNEFNVGAGTWVTWVMDANGCIVGGQYENSLPVNKWRVKVEQPDSIEWAFHTMGDPAMVHYRLPSCFGAWDGQVHLVNIIGGSGTYNARVWGTSAAGETVDSTYMDIEPNTGGLYILGGVPASSEEGFEVTVTDDNGCISAIDTIFVDQPDELTVSLEIVDGTTCFGAVDGVIEAIAEGGTGDYEYQLWKNGVIHTPWQNLGSSFLVEVGNTFTVQVRDENDCEALDTIYLETPLEVEFTVNDLSCANLDYAKVRINATGTPDRSFMVYYKQFEDDDFTTGDDEYTAYNGWFDESITIEDLFEFDAEFIGDRHYAIYVEDSEGCVSAIDTFTFDYIQSEVVADIEILETTECSETFTVTVSGGVGPYMVMVDDSVMTEMTFTLPRGTYNIIGMDSHECGTVEIVEVVGDYVTRDTIVETYINYETEFVDTEAGVDTMLAEGMHTFVYMFGECERTLNVEVVAVPMPLTIAEIQGEGAQTAVPAEDVVVVTGTVTGVSAGEGFFMQDANAAWSGIWVEYADASDLEIGDGVEVVGSVTEVATVTTLTAAEVTMIDAPLVVEAIVADSPSDAENEMWESVLVTVEGGRARPADEGNGEWSVYYEPTDDVIVNDWLYAFEPTDSTFYHVTGIVNTRLEAFKLEPRMESDIVDLGATPAPIISGVEFKVYPNPFNDRITIENHSKLTRVLITNIAGQRVIDLEYPTREIRTANLVSGVYVVSMFTEDGLAKTERIVKR